MGVRKWKYAGLGAKHSLAVYQPVSDGRHPGGAPRLSLRRSAMGRWEDEQTEPRKRAMGRADKATGVTMEMTWENLTTLFTWTAQHGADAPLADSAGEPIVIDGAITKEDRTRFMASHSEPPEG